MENYPKSGEHTIEETQYSRMFYRLVEQLEAVKNMAEDSNLSEEERKMAQDYLRENSERIEKAFNTYDAMDKKERAQKIGSQAHGASKVSIGQIEQKPAGQIHVDSQSGAHLTSKEAQDSEPDHWTKTKKA